MPIFYALCCLFFSALNDFAFKLYARKPRSKGIFILVIGIIFFLCMILLPFRPGIDWRATLIWGCISGFLSVGANLLMMEAMSVLSGGLCSTIYRLNLVPVVIGSAILFQERLSVQELIGIGFALTALILLYPKEEIQAGGKGLSLPVRGLVFMILAMLMRAAMGLCYKYGFLHGADRNGVTLFNAVFWIAGGLFYAAVSERFRIRVEWRSLLGYGVLSGVLVSGIVFFMAAALALKDGSTAIVLSIAQMSFLITVLLGHFFLREPIRPRSAVALLCGVLAVLLLTL